MEERLISKGLDDIVEELVGISDVMKSDKKYFDEELGNLIKTTISEAAQEICNSESKKEYYDKGIGDILNNAFNILIKKVSNIKIDMSPIMQISADITDQNEKILNAILNAPKPETDDSKYHELVIKLVDTIGEVRKNNESLQKWMTKETPVLKIEKKKQIEFTVTERDQFNQRIVRVLAIEK